MLLEYQIKQFVWVIDQHVRLARMPDIQCATNAPMFGTPSAVLASPARPFLLMLYITAPKGKTTPIRLFPSLCYRFFSVSNYLTLIPETIYYSSFTLCYLQIGLITILSASQKVMVIWGELFHRSFTGTKMLFEIIHKITLQNNRNSC